MGLAETVQLIGVDYRLIDDEHQEFIQLLDALDRADDIHFPVLFQALHQHTQQHFERENQLMRQSGFPAEIEHSGEHQRVLAEFKQFQARVDRGLVGFGRAFVKERLVAWFVLHVTTMDSALATHLKQTLANP